MRIPIKIDPCPIVEAIIELRFETNIPSDAIFGVFYNEINDLFGDYNKLPILQLPEEVRESEERLKYSPHYQFKKDKYTLNFGPRIINLIDRKEYSGWGEFSDLAGKTFSRFLKINNFESFKRLGLRYVNFFSENVYNLSNIDIDFPFNDSAEMTFFKTEFALQEHTIILKSSNNSNYKQNRDILKGSTLDIDVINKEINKSFESNFQSLIDKAHKVEKEVFFNCLDKDYLATLNPVYEH